MSKRDKADKPRDPPRKVKDEFHQPAGTPNAAPPPAAHEADHKAGEHAKSEPGSRHARRVVELFRHRLREKALPKALALIERTLAVVDENDPLSGWKDRTTTPAFWKSCTASPSRKPATYTLSSSRGWLRLRLRYLERTTGSSC